jgi:hypothetical protein
MVKFCPACKEKFRGRGLFCPFDGTFLLLTSQERRVIGKMWVSYGEVEAPTVPTAPEPEERHAEILTWLVAPV